MTYTTETHFKIFDDGSGQALYVGPDADGLGLVEIDGKDDFGRLILPPDLARRLVAVLTQAADSAEAASP